MVDDFSYYFLLYGGIVMLCDAKKSAIGIYTFV